MEYISINHKKEGLVRYKIYTQREADEQGLDYKHPMDDDIEKGDYILADDPLYEPTVQKVIKVYESTNSKYYRLPEGNLFLNERRTLGVYRGKRKKKSSKNKYITEPSERRKNAFVWAYITTFDVLTAVNMAFPETRSYIKPEDRIKIGEKLLDKDIIKRDVYTELQGILKNKNMDLDRVAELIDRTVEVADREGQASTMLKATQYLAELLGVSTDKLKITKRITQSSSQGIKEIMEEESNAQENVSGSMSELSEDDQNTSKKSESIETTVEATRQGNVSQLSNGD